MTLTFKLHLDTVNCQDELACQILKPKVM